MLFLKRNFILQKIAKRFKMNYELKRCILYFKELLNHTQVNADSVFNKQGNFLYTLSQKLPGISKVFNSGFLFTRFVKT